MYTLFHWRLRTNAHDLAHETASRSAPLGYRPGTGVHLLCRHDLLARLALADHIEKQLSQRPCGSADEGVHRAYGQRGALLGHWPAGERAAAGVGASPAVRG